MKIQEFNVGPRFIFGEDAISELSNLSIKKAYIVCDPYMAKSGMVHHVLDHLDQGSCSKSHCREYFKKYF